MNVKQLMAEGIQIYDTKLRRDMIGKYASRPLISYIIVRAPNKKFNKNPSTNIQMFAFIFKGEKAHFAVINGWKVYISEAQAFIDRCVVEKKTISDKETLRKVLFDVI